GERGGEALLREQRWVDAQAERRQRVERLADLLVELAEERSGVRGIPAHEPPGEAELHREGHQVLLGAIVGVALQPAALVVLRGDDPLPRRAELGRPRLDLLQAG